MLDFTFTPGDIELGCAAFETWKLPGYSQMCIVIPPKSGWDWTSAEGIHVCVENIGDKLRHIPIDVFSKPLQVFVHLTDGLRRCETPTS